MIVFEDYFTDNRNNWVTQNNENVLMQFKNKAYIFEHKRNHSAWNTYNIINNMNWKSEYKIDAVIEKLSGPNYGFGIIWNLDDNNEYRYIISENGYYRVLFREGTTWHYIIDWTYSENINRGNAVNKLTIIRNKKSLKFYINDKYTTRRNVDKFNRNYDGRIGFVIDNAIKIKIHSLIVRNDSKEIKESKKNASSNSVINTKNKKESLKSLKKELNELIGLENIKQEIETLSNFIKIQKKRKKFELPLSDKTLHMVFMGPPGTGKTTIARLIGKIYHKLGVLKKGHTIELDRAGLVAEWIGQTAIKVEQKIDEAEEGILFIDEAYSLYIEDSPRDFGHEAIEILLKRMEDKKKNFIVIVAGYPDKMKDFLKSNPGLKSRFNKYFYFDHYPPEDLVLIFKKFAYDSGYKINGEALEKLTEMVKVAYYSRDKDFGNARYIRNIFEKSIENQANRLVKLNKFTREILMEITKNDIPENYFELE